MSFEDEKDNSGNLLNNPLSIGDLLRGGTQFEINTNFDDNLPDELFDDLHIDGSDDEEENHDIMISPWEKSFNELRLQMTKLNDDIYKKITRGGYSEVGSVPDRARVIIHYNAYWEKEAAPFDSTYMRGQPHVFHCGKAEVLEGLEAAVKTMYKGEEAQFVISHRLLFHEMGCPPRVKPKADGLFLIKLINFIDVGDENAIESIRDEDKNKFIVVYDKVKDVHLKGLDFFKNGNTQGAIRSFHKAVTALEFCRLSDEKEQDEQQKFLIKLYINLAVCYIRLNYPQKACSMCNEIRKLTNINQNCKALFQEGRALLMLGEFNRAKTKLIQAQKLEPNNEEINKELKSLNAKFEEYQKNEREVWQRAMGLVKNAEKNKSEGELNFNNFKEQIRKFMKDFSEKDGPNQLRLSCDLSVAEEKYVDEIAKEFGLKLIVDCPNNEPAYVLAKIPKN